MSKVLRIFVVGKTLTGKTTMMKLLNDTLKSKGFEVSQVWGPDGPPTYSDAAHEDRVKALTGKAKVVLAEFQESRSLKDDQDDVHVKVEYDPGIGYSTSISIMGEKLKKTYPDSADGQERARSVAARFSAELGVEVQDLTRSRFDWTQPR